MKKELEILGETGRQIVTPHIQYVTLHDEDGHSAYAFTIHYLGIKLSQELSKVIPLELVKEQVSRTNWHTYESAKDFLEFVTIPTRCIIPGKTPNPTKGPQVPWNAFSHDPREEFVGCILPTDIVETPTLKYQIKLAGMLANTNQKDLDEIASLNGISEEEKMNKLLALLLEQNQKFLNPEEVIELRNFVNMNLQRSGIKRRKFLDGVQQKPVLGGANNTGETGINGVVHTGKNKAQKGNR